MLGSNLERVQKMLDIGEAALRKAELAQRKAQQKPRKIA